jgi:hypothetical protein
VDFAAVESELLRGHSALSIGLKWFTIVGLDTVVSSDSGAGCSDHNFAMALA